MQQRLRLRHARDFARLQREGRVHRDRLMNLVLAPNGLSHNRYGFITSKRLGRAVVRNRVRRHLREAVRQLHPQLQHGFDVIIIARPTLVGQHFSLILTTVRDLFYRSGLLTAVEEPPK